MIRSLKLWLACRRLNRLVAKRLRSDELAEYRRRRAAALKGLGRAI
jgi:hypothetical protein